ncbi:TOBE domain-containing protein, partial [Streptomyces sp. TRM76130]|nr:TOBE domain-containing protein [Streptomyces sp. TRM76130]
PADRCGAVPAAGGKVLVGVRPEKVALVPAADVGTVPEGRNRITGTVVDASFLGVSTQYLVDSPVCRDFTVYVQNIDRDPRLVPGAEAVLH